MKKKSLAIVMLASALAIQSFVAYGASSSSSDDNEPSYDTVKEEKSETEVTVNKDGVKTTGVTTDTSANGTSVGVVVDATMPSGKTVTVNERGEAVVGDVAIAFAKGAGATAGLPANTVAAINDINSGKALSEVIKDVDLTGYNALTGTHAIVTKDAATGAIKDTPTEVALYVPNLVGDLGNVEILYYDNVSGKWTLLPAAKIDPVTKVVYVNVTGSGTLSVVYKK